MNHIEKSNMSLKDYKRAHAEIIRKIPKPCEIIEHLDQYIIGQDHAKNVLACATYSHLYSCAHPDSVTGRVWPDNHTLIAGPSGTGKSEMIRTLCAFLGIPNYLIDCTSLSPTGYRGKNIDNLIDDIESFFADDENCSDPILVVWDECDKLWDDKGEAGKYRRMVQTDLLKILEGAPVFDNIDASKVLHIACGAFSGLEKIRFPEPPVQIGFITSTEKKKPLREINKNQIKPDHLIKFGLIPEFVGRFSRFTAMNPLGKQDLEKILTESKISFLKRKVDQYAKHGIRLVIQPCAVSRLADMAMAHPSGARGLRQILTTVLEPWDYRLPTLASDGVAEIHFHKIAIRYPTLAELIPAENAPKCPIDTLFCHGRSDQIDEEFPEDDLGVF